MVADIFPNLVPPNYFSAATALLYVMSLISGCPVYYYIITYYIFMCSRIIKIKIKIYNNFVVKMHKTNKTTT